MFNRMAVLNRMVVLYDPFIRLALPMDTFQTLVLQPASLSDGDQVLDFGCGTGALAILIKQLHSHAEVFGLDRNPHALEIAKAKALKKRVSITFKPAATSDLPFADASIDHIFSTLVFHELGSEQKRQTLSEFLRVLRPGGALHIADFGSPANWLMRFALVFIHLSHRPETLKDNLEGRFPRLILDAGFEKVEERASVSSLFGTISIWRGHKPPPAHAVKSPESSQNHQELSC